MRTTLVLLLTTVLIAPPAWTKKELHETARYPIDSEGTLTIDVADTDLAVRVGDVEQVIVTTEVKIAGTTEDNEHRWIEGHTPIVDALEGDVTIRIPPARFGFLGLGLLTRRARLGIVAPQDIVLSITTTTGNIHIQGDFPASDPLRLRTSEGKIELNGAAGSLEIRSTSGSADVTVVRPLERFFGRTASGDLTLRGGAKELRADTASGNVWASALSGPAHVETSKGKITLRWDRLDSEATVKVATHSGGVRLSLPETADPDGTLTTTSGSIRCELPGVVGEAGTTVTLQGRGPTLEVTNTRGDVVVDTGADEEQPQASSTTG